jgi:alcohol dehydrogenase (cytochrome c)
MRLARGLTLAVVGSVASLLAWGAEAASAAGPEPSQAALDDAAQNDADWLLPAHDYAGQHYVALTQINRRNAAQLRPLCAFQVGSIGSFYTSPLVYHSTLFLTSNYETLAVDARTCRLRWRTDHFPHDKPSIQANRGLAIQGGRLFRATWDGRLICMDADTGAVLWERHETAYPSIRESFDMAPLVDGDLVIIGVAGSEDGIRGWIGAFRVTDGSLVWRFDVIPKPGDPAADSWGNPQALDYGGGGIWTPVVLDPVRQELFVGTADPAPTFDGRQRPGNNLYTDSLVVLDARTGKLLWYRQLLPHDLYDRGVTAGPLYQVHIGGQLHTLVATSGKDGFLRVLDRDSHQELFSVPVSRQLNEHVAPTEDGVRVCPGLTGGVLWNGPAYSARTDLLYVPSVDWCTTYYLGGDPGKWLGRYFGGIARWDPVSESRGALTAVDAVTGAVKWRYVADAPMVAAVTATGSDLLLTGETSGNFLVLNAASGQVLYRFYTGGAVAGGVITYAIDGRQYIAVMSGGMTWFWQRPGGSATVFVFGLP